MPKLTIEENGNDYVMRGHPADDEAPAAVRHAMHHFDNQVRHHQASASEPHFAHPAADYSPPPGTGPLRTSDASPSQSGFGKALLERLGLPVTDANLAFLDAWQRAEGGSADNPFNTTQNAAGAQSINGVGVKRYASVEAGIEATAKTLTNGRYGEILDALREGNNAHQAAVAVSHTPWGSGSSVARLV